MTTTGTTATENSPRGPICVGTGHAIHYGDATGAICGAGRPGKRTPQIRPTGGNAVTCLRCRKAMR